MPRRRPRTSLPATRAIATFGALLTLTVSPMAIWAAVNDLRGSDTTGEVVSVTTDAPGRRVYTVRFVSGSGQACESKVDPGSNPPPRAVRLGDQVRVHYSWRDSCDDVREADTQGAWPGAVIVVLALLGGFGTVAYLAWRRPQVLGYPDR